MSTVLGPVVPPPTLWKSSPGHLLAAALAGLALCVAFFDPLRFMVATWGFVEEYSYGYFIPPIVAFLVWQKSDELRRMRLQGHWGGLVLIGLSLLMLGVGHLSAVRFIAQYGFVVGAFGIAVCTLGWRGTRVVAVPLAFLLAMVPLPQFVLREVSHGLQLLSSRWGVELIRAFGISVFLEGNVIDLGAMKLQVVEACSGLRYLFPLVVLGLLSACFFQAAWWKRALVVLSTVPLAIVVNSLRIGVIGITVEHWGRAMAEGVLHDFEGWFMFMLCIGLLVAEMAVLARIGPGGRPLSAVFGLAAAAGPPAGAAQALRPSAPPAWAAAALLGAVGLLLVLQPQRDQVAPAREGFSALPLQLAGGWQGRTDRLEPDVLAILALDDYALVDYTRRAGEPPVNFYAAYYARQSGGESTHSPRTCLPGGGWAIQDLKPVAVQPPGGQPLRVNRVVIAQGESRQLVYYWFRQRGASLTDEFEVKWRILRDGITMNRSDGALLRLVTPLAPGEDLARADARLTDLLGALQPQLPAFIPD